MALTNSIRREIRTLSRAPALDEQILERIRAAESNLAQPDGIDCFIETLCEAIKLKDVDLSTLALQSLKNYIDNERVSARLLQVITDTVTKTEFTSTESELVEEGYHQAVRVCRSLVKCQSSHELTNGSISEIIIFCFRVFNSKLVKWLRMKSARTLISITRTIFKRLNEFPEDPTLKPSYQIRLRLGGAAIQSTFKELANQSITSDNSSASISSSIRIITERNQSYNLAFINDFFCYLASLINPNHEVEITKVVEEKILLGLRLLDIVFNETANEIGKKSCLVFITRNNICYNIVSILKSVRSIPIISNALSLASDIFIGLRHHLKYQMEAFLERLIEMLATNSEQSPDGSYSASHQALSATIELKTDVLNTILELFQNINHFPHELYYNYDCDPYSNNIYENLVQFCSKNCFQQSLETHFTPIQLTSFKCLLANLADIYLAETNANECLVLGVNLDQNDGDNPCCANGTTNELTYNTKLFDSTKICSRFPHTYKDLNDAKKKKRLLWLALDKFNARPKDGIQFIKDNHLIDNNEDLVLFLKDNLRVDKKVLGEFLSKEENKQIREAFINSLDFTNLRIDEALRFMLEKFRLPGESQLIERILDAFSLHWFDQNKGILPNSDSALSLAYAIIMLNVDQHSKKVKPMTCDEFDKNLLGPKSDRIYDRKLLDLIYTSIRDDEIVLPDEQVGVVRQRYLWKCIMVKSDRVDSLYWVAGQPNKPSTPPPHPSPPPPPPVPESAVFQEQQPNHMQESQSESASLPPIPNFPSQQNSIETDTITSLPDATVLVINDPCELDYPEDNATADFNSYGNNNNHQQPQHIKELPLVEMNKILFEIMWSPTIAAMSFIFDKIDTNLHAELSRQIVDQGFIKVAHLCAHHGHLDNLVVSLCKFTTDLSLIPHANHSGQRHLMSDKNSLAALSLLSIIRDHANSIRNSWSNIVHNILHWYCSRCIDDIVQVDDFALQRKFTLRMREIKKSPSTMNQQSSTFLRSVYTYFAGLQPANEGKLQNGANCAPSAVQILIQTIQNAEYCPESLIELIAALTTTSIDGDVEEVEDAEVFKLEIFTQVILNNKIQAIAIWPRIRAYFKHQTSICGRSAWLGERIISAAFRVAIQFEPKPEVFSLLSQVITNLNAEIVRGDHTFTALMTLTELHAPNVSMDAKELESCFNQVIFPFLDKVLDGCDPIQSDRTLNRAINLLSKIFLKHHKILKDLQGFALLWYAILDTMDKYIKANGSLKEATFELVKNMVLVMDNEQCMSVEMKDITRTKFMFWEFQTGSEY
uniref:Golgi-specific brefeldin A-resistance guanine nucleotide exchange factor 1 n=1 Tax=Aceria tosichella TaxID=561515 RepID=A0A6G1SB55_9ACAR